MYKVKLDGYVLYHADHPSAMLTDPVLELEPGYAGVFTATVPPDNPLYDRICCRKSMVSVFRNNREIFYGEVRKIPNIDRYRNKQIYCTGALSFLADSIQPQAEYHDISPAALLGRMLEIHNSQVEPRKQIKLGYVSITDPNNSLYRYTNYENTLEAIREKLVNRLGGYLRLLHVDDQLILDWVSIEQYGNYSTQPIEFGLNLLDYSETTSAEDVVTALIPLGATLEGESEIEALEKRVDITSVNDGKNYVFSQDAVDQFGWVWATNTWDDVTVPANLKAKAEEWLSSTQFETMSLTLTAADLSELGHDYDAFAEGDRIHCLANLVVNPEQAKLVRRIYGLFLTGMSPTLIARTLTNEGIPTPSGKEKWYATSIKSILTNEKYKGDALLQKSYTTDFLTKKTKKNEGEIPQYYVKGNHEAIIDEKTFALVQTKMAARTKGQNRISSVSIFSSKVKCDDCGSWYGSKVWHSTDKYRRVIWQCNHKFDGEKCTTPTLTEDEIKRLFLQAANIAITEREELISVFESYMAPKLATDALERELADVETELNVVSGLIDNCIHENARIALNQTAYQEQIAALEARLNQAEAKKADVIAEITRRQARRQEIDQHFQYLRKLDLLTEFRDDDWLAMVDYMTVHRKDEVWVTFKDGSKIKAGL